MTERELHQRYERILAHALRSDDPVPVLRACAQDAPEPLRSWLRAACARPAGLRLSALLCARLRFERLIQGDARAAADYADDPKRFAHAFRRYHREVAPSAHGPRAESQLFAAFRTRGPSAGE